MLMSRRSVRVIISALIPRRGIMAMLKIEMAPIVIPLLLAATPSVADVTSERCQLEAERTLPVWRGSSIKLTVVIIMVRQFL